jgi:putative toxin-antitoxin system antitoxin component (TIGR02293 family)
MQLHKIEEILGGQDSLNSPLNNSLDQIHLIENGIPRKSLLKLIENISFSLKDMAELLHVSEKTLKRNELLDTPLADQIMQLAILFTRGFEVFGSKQDFLEWIDLENQALANKKPKEFLGTSVGRQLIEDILGRVEYGIYS